MIQILDKSEPIVCYFPKNLDKQYVELHLSIYNHTYQTEFIVEDIFISFLHYACYIDLSELPDGEYEYKLKTEEGDVLSFGLMSIGLDVKNQVIKEYKAFN